MSPQISTIMWPLPGDKFCTGTALESSAIALKPSQTLSFPKPQLDRHTPECVAKLVLAEKWPFLCLSHGDN